MTETLTFEDESAALPPQPGRAREDLVIGESDRTEERTVKARLLKALGRFLERFVVISGLSVFVLPLLLAAIATLDLPIGWFDGWAATASLRASNWLSRGEVLLAISVFLLLLMTRRYGAVTVSRVQGLSWLLALGICAAMLVYLAPQLTQGDMPRGRYVIGVVLSWYAGQQVAIQTYDAVRGGLWWRAPFYGALFGFAVQVLLFFPLAYGDAPVPWVSWMFVDFCIKILGSVVFLAVYWQLRRRIAPKGGLGGLAIITARRQAERHQHGPLRV
jgi:uncharacterized PurR-regulated membrane protein YhhQ (DUF165 family)